MVVGSSGFCDCGGGDDARVVSTVFSGCFAEYFWRFCILEAVGFRTVYLEVMRVCRSSQVESRALHDKRHTEVGLALSSNDDCSNHSALVLKYGILNCGVEYVLELAVVGR